MTRSARTIPRTVRTGLRVLTAMIGIYLVPALIYADTPVDENIKRVEGEVLAPKKLHAPPPSYPQIAKEERIEGRVVAQVVIDTQGKVTEIEILQSLGEDFDAVVVESLSQWEFEPATLHDEPVAVYYNLTINFRLNGDSRDSNKEG